MKNVMASAGLIALGAIGVQNAHAQFTGTAEKPWNVSATLRGFYDDNYNTAPDGVNRKDSVGFELRPSAVLSLDLENTSIRGSYVYSMKYYDDRAQNKADHSHDFEIFVNHNFSERYSLDITESFVISQEPTVLDPNNLSSVQRTDGNNIRNTGTINFHATLTEKISLVIGYSNTYYDYEQGASDVTPPVVSRSGELDRDEHMVTINGRYAFSPDTTGVLGYQFGDVEYNSTSEVILPATGQTSIARNNRSQYVYVGADHNFMRNLSASGRVGVQYTDYYNDPNTSSSLGPYAELSATWTYKENCSALLGFRHSRNQTDVVAGSGATGLVQDQESSSIFGVLSHKITPKLTAQANGQVQYSEFKGSSNLSDTFYLVGLNFNYQFTRNFSAEVGYDYDKLDSDIAGRGYDRNRVYLGFTATY